MKTVNQLEVDQLVNEYQTLVGLELQQILLNAKAMHLQFYGRGGSHWLTLSYKPGNPYFFVSDSKVIKSKGLKKPLSLFCRTHLKGCLLVTLQRNKDIGRAITLDFGDHVSLEFILIPGRVNIIARAGGKSVSLKKPSEIQAQTSEFSPEGLTLRSTQNFIEHWQSSTSAPGAAKPADSQKTLKKKQTGLEKMEDKLSELESDPWEQIGELLKETGSLESVPAEWSQHIDQDKSLVWNMENCFARHKKNNLKIEGTRSRIKELQQEIERLKSGQTLPSKGAKKESLLHEAETRGRTVQIGKTKLYIGRSGADNLKLLRKAKAWYLWLHIKDYPGAHGILERDKKADSVDESTLREAATAVIKQSVPQGHRGRFEVIFAECRYVRPIKGAKSGQVTYSHEKVIAVEV